MINPPGSAPEEADAAAARRPRVSVVMNVGNDLRFLDAAVDSILQQRFGDFEFVIVDDGTGERAVFDAIGKRDPRIRIVVNPANLGATAAANRGIAHASADIIVRIDADDIAEAPRIERLVAALDADPQLGLIGSAVTLIDEAGAAHGVSPMPETDLDIRWTLLFHNPFYHSAVAFRRSLFEAAGRYRPEQLVSNDHYLWFDMLPLCRARNLAEPLARYRMNSRGIIAAHMTKDPRGRTHAIREALWRRIGLAYDLYDDALARDISDFLRGGTIAAPDRRAAAYRKLLNVLRAFLAAPQPLPRDGDAATARSLRRTLVARMLADPPRDWRERLAVLRLCLAVDAAAAGQAMAARLMRRA
jgi:glycosyltransferase involved in cell wall biosynthesis